MSMFNYRARQRDEVIAQRFNDYEFACTSSNRWNSPFVREKRSAARRAATYRKLKNTQSGHNDYRKLENEMEMLKQLHDGSLERKREIEARIKEIGKATSSTLREEKKTLKAEIQEGLEKRKAWAAQLAVIKNKQAELQNNTLKNMRVRDRRPWTATSSTTPNSTPWSSPMKENVPQSSTSQQPVASTSSPHIQLVDSDEEGDDIFQDLDPNVVDDVGHWLPPSLEPTDMNMLENLPSFEEFNREFMSIAEEGGPNSDIDVFSPSGAPTTQLQSFQVDKASMAVMERFLQLFPSDDDDIYEALHIVD